MIQSTSLLSLPASLSQGAARQPGSGAFVLPDGDEAVGDIAASLADEDGSGRQDDATGGNGLPATVPAIDPWLVATLLSPALSAGDRTPPASPVTARGLALPTVSEPSVAAIRAASSRLSLDTINRPAVAPPVGVLDHLLADEPAVPMPQDTATPPPTEGKTATLPLPPGSVDAPLVAADAAPSRRLGGVGPVPTSDRPHAPVENPSGRSPDRPAVSVANIPASGVMERGHPNDVPEAGVARSDDDRSARADDGAVLTTADTSAAPITSTIARPSAAPAKPSVEPSAALPDDPPAAPTQRAVTLPGAALRSSALTPLHRDEAALVATLISPEATRPVVASRSDAAPQASAMTAAAGTYREAPPPVVASAPTSLVASPAADAMLPAPAAPIAPARAEGAPVPAVTLPLGWHLSAPALAPSSDERRVAGPAASPNRPLPGVQIEGTAVLPAPVATGTTTIAGFPSPRASLPLAHSADPGDRVATPAVAAEPASSRASAPAAPMQPSPSLPLTVAAPSSVVFGAARYAAQTSERREEPPSIIGGVAGTAPLAQQPAIAAAPVAQAPIDVRHERWPTAMIDRIEMIRDAANEVDTRIRLVPDALGLIDVDVRRDGDTLHVRFTAAEPQTRALLQDAAPRLADAAESRGLRLGQTTVGGDASGTAQQHQQQDRRQPLPLAPVRAPQPTAEATADVDDTRLA